jgi:hypothetical protein
LYRFVKKIAAFTERYQRIQYNERRRQQKAQQAATAGETASLSSATTVKDTTDTASTTPTLTPEQQEMKVLFQAVKPYLQGEAVYQQLVASHSLTNAQPTAAGAKKVNAKATANETPATAGSEHEEWSKYQELLFQMSIGVDGLMERRIRTSPGNNLHFFSSMIVLS